LQPFDERMTVLPGILPANPSAMADLLCTTDLTAASTVAIQHAMALGDRLGARVSLLHVVGKEERRSVDEVRKSIEQTVDALGGAAVQLLMPEGDFMEEIVAESARGHRLLVMGTHGAHGLRQKLFGADILKLVRKAATPCFVVQEGSPVDRELCRIVLPVAGHQDIGRLLDAVCLLARACAAEVHVFQLMRPGEAPSDVLLANKVRMFERLEEEGIRQVEANEPMNSFSMGFAKATIDYAQRIGAGCIAIMAHASDEYRYIADAEKERILSNPAAIPVLCA